MGKGALEEHSELLPMPLDDVPQAHEVPNIPRSSNDDLPLPVSHSSTLEANATDTQSATATDTAHAQGVVSNSEFRNFQQKPNYVNL